MSINNLEGVADPYEGDDSERAAVDLLLVRPELGENAHTLIAAGDPIPADLADCPRLDAATLQPIKPIRSRRK